MQSKIGVILMNLGTPDAPTPTEVRRFLKAFLSDPYVIDLPTVLRYLLLYGAILPFRSKKSAKAYQSIWEPAGSPLLVYSEAQRQALQRTLGSDFVVTLGMRYGNPNVAKAIDTLKTAGCTQTLLFPLYPQYAESSTRTAKEDSQQQFDAHWPEHPIRFIQPYYDHPHYIEALSATMRDAYFESKAEHLIFSFHSVPIRHIKKVEPETGVPGCVQGSPCPAIRAENADCYRAQCYATARLLAEQLKLKSTEYSVCFQSTLGKTAWVGPSLQEVFNACRAKAYDNIAVACPGFAVDCLETLEEINLRARDSWNQLGGTEFHYLPCLNSNPHWIAAMARILSEQLNPSC